MLPSITSILCHHGFFDFGTVFNFIHNLGTTLCKRMSVAQNYLYVVIANAAFAELVVHNCCNGVTKSEACKKEGSASCNAYKSCDESLFVSEKVTCGNFGSKLRRDQMNPIFSRKILLPFLGALGLISLRDFL